MVIWAVLLFISACIIADTVRYYDNEKKKTGYTMCHWLAHYIDRSNARCGHLIGATVCDHTIHTSKSQKPSTSCVHTACYKLSTSLEQAVKNL